MNKELGIILKLQYGASMILSAFLLNFISVSHDLLLLCSKIFKYLLDIQRDMKGMISGREDIGSFLMQVRIRNERL